MFNVFSTIFLLSLALFAAPGPITVQTVRQGVKGGFWPALSVQLGATAAELLWAVALLLGLAPLVGEPSVQASLTVFGAAFLCWTAWQALHEARTPRLVATDSSRPHHGALVGLLYAGGNPFSALFWLGVAGLLPSLGVAALQPTHVAVIGSAYLLGALVWGVPIAALATWGGQLMHPRVWRWWNATSGFVLAGYGVHLLWAGLLVQ